MMAPVTVPPCSSSFLARPKSLTLGVPSRARSTLAGLRSPVDHPGLVGRLHASRQFLHQESGLAGWHRGGGQLLVQAAAGAELQREEEQALVIANLEDLYDVGVLQAGDGLCLVAEAGQLRGPRMAAGQD